jgi:deoxyribodipyrimidine photo-lyase
VGVGWTEFQQFGVVRRLKSRNTWQARWEAHMAVPQAALPALQFFSPPESHGLESMRAPPDLQHNPTQRQHGSRRLGLETLHSFLDARALSYRGGISSPLSSHCRLASPSFWLPRARLSIA